MSLRLAFMGTPDFACPALQRLLTAGHEIAAVYTQPPRPAGRGKRLQASPVQRLAEDSGLELRHPETLKTDAAKADFAALDADAAIVVAYGQILPRAILEAPKLGCLNIHASLLPRWRGAAPIQRAIMAGDAETGVTIMRLDTGMDTGPVLTARATPIGPRDTAGDLHDRLSEMGADLLIDTLAGYAAGRIAPSPQPAEGVTHAPRIDKAEGRIDWSRPAVEIDRQVRGLTPFPGAFAEIGGERLKILSGVPVAGSGKPGEVLDARLTIACDADAYRIDRAQRPGRAPLDSVELQRGLRIAPGSHLG